jgi:hypothetical protein
VCECDKQDGSHAIIKSHLRQIYLLKQSFVHVVGSLPLNEHGIYTCFYYIVESEIQHTEKFTVRYFHLHKRRYRSRDF